MIHLDTNVLIGLAETETSIVRTIGRWLDADEKLAVSSLAWFEFHCGPLEREALDLIEHVVAGRVITFNHEHALRAADLFNIGGRQRASRWDCMIAATAIESRARLATRNASDFARFKPYGLELVSI